MVVCAVYGCKVRSDRSVKVKGVTFHAFPSNPIRRARWVDALRRNDWQPSKYSKICSQHFREEDIDRTSVSTVRIREHAVPTIIPRISARLQKKKKKRGAAAPRRKAATKLQAEDPEDPGLPPTTATPVRKCFVCSKDAGPTGLPLTALTNTTRTPLHQKLTKIIGAELDLVVDEDGVICNVCCRLLNYVDRIEVEYKLLTKSVVDCMRWTTGLGSLRDDSSLPEAVLASIEDNSKNSRVSGGKCGLSLDVPDVPAQDTPDEAVSWSKTAAVSASNAVDRRRNQTQPVDKVTEKKKNQTQLVDRASEKKQEKRQETRLLTVDRGGEKRQETQPLTVGRASEKRQETQPLTVGRASEKRQETQLLTVGRASEKRQKTQSLLVDRASEKRQETQPLNVDTASEKKQKTQPLLISRVSDKKTDAEQDKPNYHCKVCNFKTKHKSVFLFHLQRHVQSGYRCDFCDVLLPKDLSSWIASVNKLK